MPFWDILYCLNAFNFAANNQNHKVIIMKKFELVIVLATIVFSVSGCKEKKQESRNVIEVITEAASASNITHNQSYSGTIEERSGSTLSFASTGTLMSLPVHEGQYVSAGQLIGVIDASTTGNAVAISHAATVQAQESLKQAEDAYARMKQLHDNGSLPEIKWVEVQTKVAQARQMIMQARASEKIARKGLKDTRLIAPFSGYVVTKQAEIGQNVMPGQPIVRLVKIDDVKVKISVPEDEISEINLGQKIEFKVGSLHNETFFGIINEKSVEADPISRSYTVKAVVNNAGHRLLPGMVCDVYVSNGSFDQGITLPANIIQIDENNKTFVWTVVNGKAHKVEVDTGENVGANVMVISGLSEGMSVIISGQQKVSEGMTVQIKNNK